MKDQVEKCISSRGKRLAPAPVSKDQSAFLPDVVADANLHNVHLLSTINRVRIVVAANPVGHTDIAAMVEQLNQIR
jgi:hypothetical protein